jgi:hypothetical protein
MEQERFVMLPYNLMAAHGYYSLKTGEQVKMSQGVKFVYLYLKDRNNFFVNIKGGDHFESQGTIAEAVGMDVRRVGTILTELMAHSVVVATLEKCANGRRYHYHKINDLSLWTDKKEASKIKAVAKPNPSVVEYTDEFLSGIVWEREDAY